MLDDRAGKASRYQGVPPRRMISFLLGPSPFLPPALLLDSYGCFSPFSRYRKVGPSADSKILGWFYLSFNSEMRFFLKSAQDKINRLNGNRFMVRNVQGVSL